jgi:hypothetical protein
MKLASVVINKKKSLSLGIFILIICFMIACIILSFIYSARNKDSVQVISQNFSEYKILIDVEESLLYVLENNQCIQIYRCAGGKARTPSPIGTWKIKRKAKWGEGFGGRWLELDVPWGNFGIHGTTDTYSVGRASSHGCIRMNNSEVAELYKMIPIGTTVVIVDGPYREFGKGFRYLKSGMYGSDVKAIQERLKELGFFEGTPNGRFGAETERAVQRYCRANNIKVTKTIDIELQKQMGFELID